MKNVNKKIKAFILGAVCLTLLSCGGLDQDGIEELDSDMDGVINTLDLCNDTPVGVKVDTNGCAIPLIISEGQKLYDQHCLACHGDSSGNSVTSGDALIAERCDSCASSDLLHAKIRDDMPFSNATSCDAGCASEIAKYIFANFDGFDGLPPPKAHTVTLEAENGVLEGKIESNDGSHIRAVSTNGINFVENIGFDNKIGFYQINFAIPGRYSMVVHYASGENRDLDIESNGETIAFSNLNSGNFNSTFSQAEKEFTITRPLINIIASLDSGQAVNIDKIVFTLVEERLPEPINCSVSTVGGTPLQRLSSTQYANTVKDIFNVELSASNITLPGDERISDLFKGNIALPLGEAPFEQYMLAAEYVGKEFAKSDLAAKSCDKLYINAGGGEYYDPGQNYYIPDKYFSTSNVYSVDVPIKGTSAKELYNTTRWHNAEFSYAVPIASGTYKITLHFAEIYYIGGDVGGAGKRIFNVHAENNAVVNNLDIFNTVGANAGHNEIFNVEVSDGVLDLSFIPVVSDPTISGIRIQPVSGTPEACISRYIDDLALQVYRRPISAEEKTELGELHAELKAASSTEGAVAGLVAYMLQSPNFLYRAEGNSSLGAYLNGATVDLNDYELATRLSFFLWNLTPDSVLLDLAKAGQLSNPDVYQAQVDRLLSHPNYLDSVSSFYAQWLGIDNIESLEKTRSIFPNFSAELSNAMRRDTLDFVTDIYSRSESRFADLFSPGGFTYTNHPELLNIYGVSSDGQNPTALPRDERSGLLTQPSVMAVFAHASQSSPVQRGQFVRERLLCQELPPPPPTVADVEPEPDPNATTRERFSAHSVNPACASCHALMDPLGFPLDNFDAVGALRTTENGIDLDLSGSLIGTDINGEFVGPLELSERLAQSHQVQTCFVENWLTFALSRGIDKRESCTVEDITTRLINSGGDLSLLMREIVESDLFKKATNNNREVN